MSEVDEAAWTNIRLQLKLRVDVDIAVGVCLQPAQHRAIQTLVQPTVNLIEGKMGEMGWWIGCAERGGRGGRGGICTMRRGVI